jgi:hypothetical protein
MNQANANLSNNGKSFLILETSSYYGKHFGFHLDILWG